VERRDITDDEREALHRFLKSEISFEKLLNDLHGMLKIEFLPAQRRQSSYFNLVAPPVLVSKGDVENAISKRRSGGITEGDLIRWATTILLYDAFVWEGEDEDEIVDALNDLSIGGLELYERNKKPV
jgi:hypothetical protein